MTTLFGFGSTTAPPDAPQDPVPGRSRPRWLRLAALACGLVLLAPVGGPGATPRATTPSIRLVTALAQVHPGALKAPAIAAKVHPALYTLATFDESGLPTLQTAFAYGRLGGATLLATTYQNVLRASDPSIAHRFPKNTGATEGGARIDPSFPKHQVVLVRHGSVTFRAQVIAAELERDLAVLSIPGKHRLIAPECLGGEDPGIGDRTYAFSAGSVAGSSSPQRSFGRITTFLAPEQIQSSQRVRGHGEGGPLVNIRGNVIGVAARSVDVVGLKDIVASYTLSVDLNVAFELAGQSNDCPKEAGSPDTTTAQPKPGERLTRAQLAEATLPAVVSIESLEEQTDACPTNCETSGSGFGVYTDGSSTWVATNHHVLGSSRFLSDPAVVVRKDDNQYLADIVASDKDMDVALVKVDTVLPVLAPACGAAKNLKKGQQVAAIGSPGDLLLAGDQRFSTPGDVVEFSPWNDKGALTLMGLISIGDVKVPFYLPALADGYGLAHGSTRGYLPDTVTYGHIVYSKYKDVRHTAKIYHGNSGGPLLNMFGQVVAINERFGKHGERIAINIDRLFGRLAAKAGIPNPCGATK